GGARGIRAHVAVRAGRAAAAAAQHACRATHVIAPRRAFIAKHVLLFLAFKLFCAFIALFRQNIIFAMLKMTSS
ncbi:MAG: hypothetical protein RXR82_00255, partial [Nitrososphaeria archaeon]